MTGDLRISFDLDEPRVALALRAVWAAVLGADAPPAVRRAVGTAVVDALRSRPDTARAVLRSLADDDLAALVTTVGEGAVLELVAAATDGRRYALATSRDVIARVTRAIAGT